MPRRDGTGPLGKASTGKGRGRMGGSMAAGPSGLCSCPACGFEIQHQQGMPCTSVDCPKCGSKMTRK